MSKKTILFAPSWNYNNKNLFNDHAEKIINLLNKNKYKVILRPHPEIFKRNKEKVQRILNLFQNSEMFEVDKKSSNIESMESTFVLITDNSTIGMEYALALKKPVIYINYSKKIHNLDYKKIYLIPLEETFQKTIGFNVFVELILQTNRIKHVCFCNMFAKIIEQLV